MGLEIEKKFLVKNDTYKHGATGTLFRQGYLNTHKERTVRVRLEGTRGKLTIKGLTVGATRSEFDYDIPAADAEALLGLCEQPLIEKTRYRLLLGDRTWEIDEFHGVNQGLVVAEIELPSEDAAFAQPEWAGSEVTNDRRYFNSNLIAHPFTTWVTTVAKESV